MNYYEELGLTSDATAPEIRHAYRVAARLVHPDGHADEPVRAMAERQMKRLNEMLAILTDPQRRYEYDLALEDVARLPVLGPAAPGPAASNSGVHWQRPVELTLPSEPWWTRAPEWAQSTMRNGFWIFLAMVMLCVGLWYLADMPSTPVTRAQTEQPPPDEKLPAGPKAHKAAKPNVARVFPAEPKPAIQRPTGAPAEEIEIPHEVAAPLRETDRPQEALRIPEAAPEPSTTSAMAAKPEPSRFPAVRNPAGAASFAGNWLYLPATDAPAPGTYPATYVEMLLNEDKGELAGTYRAQYKVPDLALSPDVAFRVQGKLPADKSATLTWTSGDGAKGEAEMTLLGPNLMNLSWWTTKLGRRPMLGSGTTKLIRQQQP
jgi:hypothetical protein